MADIKSDRQCSNSVKVVIALLFAACAVAITLSAYAIIKTSLLEETLMRRCQAFNEVQKTKIASNHVPRQRENFLSIWKRNVDDNKPENPTNKQTRRKGRRRKGKKKKGKGKKRCTCPKPESPISSAHFVANEKISDLLEGKLCIWRADWEGEICNDRTFKSPYDMEPLKFWKRGDEHVPAELTAPVKMIRNSEIVIEESGLYIVYSNVLYYDAKLMHSQAIFINGQSRFKCMDSTDSVDPSKPPEYNARYKSCSISGVAYLKKDDIVTVINIIANSTIDLTEDATYFGVIRLSHGIQRANMISNSREH